MSLGSNTSTPRYINAAEELRGNDGQWRAYESKRNCVILAGPGSGKTKTLTIKMARMLAEDVAYPRGMACITYSAECARELERRLEKLGISESKQVFIGTVHSFCLKHIVIPYAKLAGLALPEPWRVASSAEQDQAYEEVFYKSAFGNGDPRTWRTPMTRYRRTHLDRTSADWNTDSDLAELVVAYEKELRKKGLIDFDDMALLGLQLIEQNEWVRQCIQAKFPILVVDEYQDLGIPLHRMVLSLCFDQGIRLLAVGDPDQSIYGFTGAKPELLLELAKSDEIEAIRLKMNYRCAKKIVVASQGTLGYENSFDTPSNAPEGQILFYKSNGWLDEQAREIFEEIIPGVFERHPNKAFGDIAILYTNKLVGDQIAEQAKKSGIKYIRIDQNAPYNKTPFTRWLEDCAQWSSGGWQNGTPRLSGLVQKWLGFHPTLRSDTEQLAARRSLIHFLWNHRDPTLLLNEWLQNFFKLCLKEFFEREASFHEEISAFKKLYEASKEGNALSDYSIRTFAGQRGSSEHINLITLHSAKGREFDIVIMPGMEANYFPHSKATESEKKENLRLFYVGVTRAIQEVHLLYSKNPSEFLIKLSDSLPSNET